MEDQALRDFDKYVAPELIRAGDKIRDEFTARFKAAVAAGDPIAYSPELGFANRPEDIGPDGYAPRAPIKFAYKVRPAVDIVRTYLPFFAGIRSVYEIGVGAGYLLRALIDTYGIEARGCDVELDRRGVYKAIRAELGLTDLVEEQWIIAGTPIRIPPGTQAVTTFMSVFDAGWALEEYRWFISEMRRNGVSRLLWRPNKDGTGQSVREYFSSLGGTFPVEEDKNRFAVIPL